MQSLWRPISFTKHKITSERLVLSCTLLEKIELTSNVRNPVVLFRFGLPPSTTLDNKILNCVSVSAVINGIREWRNYTPLSHGTTQGHFEIMVKVYPEGLMGNYLRNLELGDSIDVSQPRGKRSYEMGRYARVGIIAGGVGLAPMIQVIERTLQECPGTQITLLFANQTRQDVIFYERLSALEKNHSNFKFHPILSQPDTEWTGLRGRVNKQLIEEMLPEPADDSLLLFCGPKPMNKNIKQVMEEQARVHFFKA
jgi:cytochrome-b5 reductase